MKRFDRSWLPALLVWLCIALVLSTSGCIELARTTQSVETLAGSISVVKVQYLYTDDGFLTSKYIVDVSLPLVGKMHSEMSEKEYEAFQGNLNNLNLLSSSGSVTSGSATASSVTSTKSVGVTAKQSDQDIIVTYQGGSDHGTVKGLQIQVTASTGQSTTKEYGRPLVGQKFTLTNAGTSGQDGVTVTATFSDGSMQVVLDTYV
jgi:hypothetical protein